MIRLLVALLHTALAAGTTTGALLVLGQARANAAWEMGFYGVATDLTSSLLGAAVVAIVFGVAHAVGAWAWFAGSRAGGWMVILASALLAAGTPGPLSFVITTSAIVVVLDGMVSRHREANGDPSSR